LFNNDKEPIWESTENRSISLIQKSTIKSIHQWDVEQLVDIRSLAKLQPDKLMEDYKIIETMILDVHPGTYRYNNKASIHKALDELKTAFQKPLTHGEAYLAMSKLTASVQCDHTAVGFNNQNKIINSVIHRQADKLPFAFGWIEGKMIVLHDATKEKQLERGTEIMSINGVRISEIKETMMTYIGADGATDKSRLAKMQVEGYDFRYYPFDVFYPLLYPIKDQNLTLEIKAFEQEIKTIKVSSISRDERTKVLTDRYPSFPKTRDELWNFEINKDNIGVFTLNSYGLLGWKKLTIDYKEYLKNVFKELKEKKIKHLIIDIRKNFGGNDEIKEELFSYLKKYQKTNTSNSRVGKTRYTRFPELLKNYCQSWGDPWYYDLKPDQIDVANGYYLFYEQEQKSIKKKSIAFSGDIYLLTSPANASLAFYTAKDFKQNKMGTIVGQETGGNLRDINGGQILFLRLPNSSIEIDFPVMGGFTIEEKPNQGVLPDYNIEPNQKDIYHGVDTAMEATLKLIKK